MPPEWGGITQGGVATFHATLLSEIADHPFRYRTRIVGVVPTYAESPAHVPARTLLPGRGEQVRRSYVRILGSVRPDAVLFNHIATEWALVHARVKPGIPGIGVVHSWHPLTFGRSSEDRSVVWERIQEAADGLDLLVFPSRFCHDEGIGHGFRYPPRTKVIHFRWDPCIPRPRLVR